MPFTYARTIRLADTDAAGVVFFPRYLEICHEAYEAALLAAGIDLKSYFAAADGLTVPIVRSEAEYLRPLYSGDRIEVVVTPIPANEHEFALAFELSRIGPPRKTVARVRTEHVCISAKTRERSPLSAALTRWVGGG
ncbi:MAG: acyl-CoA thioesterase [Bryobacterales bacterium]|nr:acyl-CoA thioesterase [Opitutaceae bacterium]MCZ2155160.1 acyl-CoA thioesterase [Bryobacterales bacterium]